MEKEADQTSKPIESSKIDSLPSIDSAATTILQQRDTIYTPPKVQCSKCKFTAVGRNALNQHMTRCHSGNSLFMLYPFTYSQESKENYGKYFLTNKLFV
jgi:hypothetical protein